MATEVIYQRIKLAAKTSTVLASENKTPLERELVIELNTGKTKLGNGTQSYNQLPYFLFAATVAFADITGKPTTLAGYGLTISNADWSGTALTVANGGTGATTASTARTNLGLGTMAVEAAASFARLTGAAFTGGITGTTARFTGNGTFGGAALGTTAQLELTGNTFAYLILDDKTANTGRRYALGSGFTRAGTFGIYDCTAVKTLMEFDSNLALTPGADNTQAMGSPTRRWSQYYGGSAAISTSDEREKKDIYDIPDEWLDAWGDVQWCRFRFTEGSRWHVGLIAQRVRDAFAARGLDATEIGLLCYDKWDDVTTPVMRKVTKTREVIRQRIVRGKVRKDGTQAARVLIDLVQEPYEEDEPTGEVRVVIPAGDRWGLRYEECLAMEAAWVRRRLAGLS